MEEVIVWKHTLENLAGKIYRASNMCYGLEQRTADVRDKIEEVTNDLDDRGVEVDLPVEDTIYDIGNVLSLLSESFEDNAYFLSELARTARPVSRNSTTPAKIPLPENINLSDFDEISNEELTEELYRQEAIIAAAELDKGIILETLARRIAETGQARRESEGDLGVEPATKVVGPAAGVGVSPVGNA